MADQIDDILDDRSDKKSNKFLIILVTSLIVLIWLAIFVLLIKLDVGGFGSNVLRPVLKDIPVINKILPGQSDVEAGLDSEYPYTTLSQAIERIRELEGTLAKYEEAAVVNSDTIAQLTAEVARLKPFEQHHQEYVALRRAYDEEVVFGDKAIDPMNYVKYYETVSPDNAADIYEMVLERHMDDEVIVSLAKSMAGIEAEDAARILEGMTGDLEKVARILANMKEVNRGNILAAMDDAFAEKVILVTYPTPYER